MDDVHIIFYFPGRVKLRVDRIKTDPAYCIYARNRLAQIAALTQLELDTHTGKISLHYDRKKIKQPDQIKILTQVVADLFPSVDVARLVKWLS